MALLGNMAMKFSEGAQDALVQWANTFSPDKKADAITDLYDGVLLSHVLFDLDTSYDPSEIDTEADRWLTQKKNLQSIYKGLVRLVNRNVPELSGQARISDFRAIASDPDAQGICKVSILRTGARSLASRLTRCIVQILSLMFAVAMLGSNNERFVMRITKDITDSAVLSQLQKITVEMKGLMDETPVAGDSEAERELTTDLRDPDLALEEENAELHAELDKTKKRLADTTTRLENLKVSYDDLTDETTKLSEELEAFRSAQDGTSDHVVRALEAKLREQDELILSQENQAEDDRNFKSKLTHEITTLKAKADKAEKYEDEANELRFKVEELTRKANMAERYKQKLEAQADIQKEMDNLIYEKQQMQQDLIEYEKLLKRNKALEDTNEQYAKRMHDYEVNFIEMDSQRRAAQAEMNHLKDLIRTHEAQSLADERFITELQEQINSGAPNQARTRTPDTEAPGFNLEEELENAKEVAPNLSVEISRLKAENNLLRNSVGSGSENARLRQELEDERAQRKRLQGDYNLSFEKQKVAERDMHEMMKALEGKELVIFMNRKFPRGGKMPWVADEFLSNEILNNLKANIERANKELEQERATSRDLREKLTDQSRDLLSAQTDLSAVEKGSVEALEELKQTDQLMSSSLREDLEALRLEFKNATTDADETQRALVKALLEKDSLRKEVDTLKDQGPSEQGPEAQKNVEKVKQLRTRLQERNEVSDTSPLSSTSFRHSSYLYTRDHIEYETMSRHLPQDPRFPPMFIDANISTYPTTLRQAVLCDSRPDVQPEPFVPMIPSDPWDSLQTVAPGGAHQQKLAPPQAPRLANTTKRWSFRAVFKSLKK